MQIHSHPDHCVAVIGAGPAGLTTARWLLSQGLEPVLFEASARLGGQWNGDAPTSGTWAGMRTNTSRVMTAFSDLDYPAGTATYPARDEVQAYLARYADLFGLTSRIRFRTRIEWLGRATGGGWCLRTITEGRSSEEVFARVVVATGRHTVPEVPRVSGLDTFAGSLGVLHSAQYGGADRFRGASVLVAGCSISALEIATELAQNGVDVTTSYRRQRYVLPKLVAGVPTEHVMFHRAAALAGEILPPEALGEGLKATVLRLAGSPDQFGAQRPDANIFAAGITQSHGFLPAVAEGRIRTRPWIEQVEGRTIHFADGSRDEFDAILFGTGYRLSLPWLAADLAAVLGLDGVRVDLHAHTFHPDLPGLAFIGLYDLVGPYFPVLEQQARWLAYAWGGTIPAATQVEMEAGLAAARAARGRPQSHPMNAMALHFARLAGVEPDLAAWPDLERALFFGPLSAVSFRLSGPDALPDAPERTQDKAAAFGYITGPEFELEEQGLHDLVRSTLPRAA